MAGTIKAKGPYGYLRRKILMEKISLTELADRCGISRGALSDRLQGKSPFRLSEAYAVLDALGADEEDLHLYFPPGGCDTPDEKKRKTANPDGKALVDRGVISALKAIVRSIGEEE